MPKVSVIIPNYNHERYLKQRIESVLNQTYQDFELIILDDKSTDNSKDVIEQYRNHTKVSKIVYNEFNSGTTFKQWNKGITLSVGELIWLAESDDDASEFFLEDLVEKFDENPKLGIVYCDSYYLNEKNEKLQCTHIWKNERFATNRWDNDYENSGIKEVNDYLIYHNIIDNASSAMFKKEALFNAGLADESFRYAGDMYLYMKVLLVSDVAYVAKPLNYFREHAVNTSKESFVNGLRPLEGVLSYSKLLLNNKLISKETRTKRNRQAVTEYRYFFYINSKLNRNIKLLLKGHLRLLNSNLIYSFQLFTGTLKNKFFKQHN